MGLDDLLFTGWRAPREAPLRLIGPPGTAALAEALSRAHAIGREAEGRALDLPPAGASFEVIEVGDGWSEEREGLRLIAGPISGGPLPALAWRIEAQNRSVVVSGTGWSEDTLVEFALGANMLVHEAVYIPPPEDVEAAGMLVDPERLRREAEMHTALADVLIWNPDGLFVSNGPGDPRAMPEAIAMAREAMGRGLPIFGICLGHQLMALAQGFEVYKMFVGHRGANQPVKNLVTGRVEVTTQNHGFSVDPESVDATQAEVTHVNLNDQTVEGLRFKTFAGMSVQYHPEASPGPHDSRYLFEAFLGLIERSVPVAGAAVVGHGA